MRPRLDAMTRARLVCSASNYLLGFTPLTYGPYLVGTVAGMSVWSIVYASLGGAGRVLLQQRQASLADVLHGMSPCHSSVFFSAEGPGS